MSKFIYVTQSNWLNAKTSKSLVNTNQILYVTKVLKRDKPPSVLTDEDKQSYEDKANSEIILNGYSLRVVETVEEIEKILNEGEDFG